MYCRENEQDVHWKGINKDYSLKHSIHRCKKEYRHSIHCREKKYRQLAEILDPGRAGGGGGVSGGWGVRGDRATKTMAICSVAYNLLRARILVWVGTWILSYSLD